MIALTIGSFDPVHVDHVMLFRWCEQLGKVIVGVNSDAFYFEYRGVRPMFSQGERMAQVEALGYETQLNDGPGIDLIRRIGPDYLVVGHDWLGKDYLGQLGATPEDLEEVGLIYIPRGITVSAETIRRRMELRRGEP